MSAERVDIGIVGAGAAGLMAGIWAGRQKAPGTGHRAPGAEEGGPLRIVALDGARRIGAKILVAGGGRCNVTHHQVDETAYAGSSRNAIRRVLGRFDVARTVEFFRELGVELKREETGKLFPVSDDAHTVLEALLREARRVGVEVRHPWRVGGIRREAGAHGEQGFVIERAEEAGTGGGDGSRSIWARRVILATGGMALPKSGSDGFGYWLARGLGHSTTERIFPALAPLTLPKGFFLCELSGIAAPATLELRSGTGKRLVSFTNSVLLTHFGVSGPGVLDISRYYTAAVLEAGKSARPRLLMGLAVGQTAESLDARLAEVGRASGAPTALRFVTERLGLAERLARALCALAGVEASASLASLAKERRRGLAAALTELELPITGDRGFTYAEVTAGGVPLSEVHLETMESRVCPGLHLCGEILDVDGRIGGFNFQWAWASGFVAGSSCGS